MLAFAPVADVFVDAGAPARNFSGDARLRADGSPGRISYLRFVVSGTGGRPVLGAQLQLSVTSGSTETGGTVHLLSDPTWDKQTVTWANRPALGSALSTLGAVASGTVVAFDVGAAITGDGIYDLALASGSDDGVTYRATGGTTPPRLVVTVAGSLGPSVRIVRPAAGGVHRRGEPLRLEAVAQSSSGADLGAAVAWSSSLDGPLGQAATLVVTTLSAGVHELTATVVSAEGSASDRVTVTVIPPGLVFGAVADTSVDAELPTVPSGSATSLKVDYDPGAQALLRFVVTGVNAPVKSATLRLTVGTSSGAASDAGGRVYRISDDTWSEATTTYATRPAVDGAALSTRDAVAVGAVVDFDVTAAVAGNGTYDFAVVGRSSDSTAYRSREAGAGRPALVLVLRAPSDPTVTISQPVRGTALPYGQPLGLAGTASDPEDGDLSGALTWTSSLDGALGTGRALALVLNPGTHAITAAVIDGHGNRSTATTSVTVTVPPAGRQDFVYGSTVETNGNRATAEKPESKLWHHRGRWWATLFNPLAGTHRIHRLEPASQTWVDTGTLVDARPRSRQDVLVVGDQLYALSRHGKSPARNRLLRYTYVAGADTWSLDPGFPVDVTTGAVETMTLARDSTGRLWVAYTFGNRVFVTHSFASDTQWAVPFVVPVAEGTSVNADDIAAVIALPGHVGVFWNDHVTSTFYFALHADGAAPADPAAWRLERAAQGANIADDHINLKVAADGRLFAAVKTDRIGPDATMVGLLVRSPAGVWSPLHKVAAGTFLPTRPQCLLDDSRRRVHVFYTADDAAIHYKSSDMDRIAFPGGIGAPAIVTGGTGRLNNVTTTRQAVDASTGIVVLASDVTTHSYWHHALAP
jgi:hypothetical protein